MPKRIRSRLRSRLRERLNDKRLVKRSGALCFPLPGSAPIFVGRRGAAERLARDEEDEAPSEEPKIPRRRPPDEGVPPVSAAAAECRNVHLWCGHGNSVGRRRGVRVGRRRGGGGVRSRSAEGHGDDLETPKRKAPNREATKYGTDRPPPFRFGTPGVRFSIITRPRSQVVPVACCHPIGRW